MAKERQRAEGSRVEAAKLLEFLKFHAEDNLEIEAMVMSNLDSMLRMPQESIELEIGSRGSGLQQHG